MMLLRADRFARVAVPIVGRRAQPWPAAVLASGFAAFYTWFVLLQHWSYRTGAFDLGIFDQAVHSYAHGHLPVSTIRDPNMILLGDHFHPILAVLAPFHRIFPMAETLLVAQALLFAASVYPITRLACTTLGAKIGVVIGICYGFSWGLLHGLVFDFHEIAFAMPLLAFAMVEFLHGRAGRAVAIAAPLVLVKEDLGLTLAVLGFLIALRPETRRLGVFTAIGGTAASLLSVLVIVPAFSPYNNYRYFGKGGLEGAAPGLNGALFSTDKLWLVGMILLPTLFVALRSPLILLLLPTLGWRLGGTNVLYWLPNYHYDAVLMPIVFCAMIHGLVLLRPYWVGRRRRLLLPLFAAGLSVVCFTYFMQSSIPNGPGKPAEFAAAANRLVDRIPRNVTVSTTGTIAPHLTSKADVYQLHDNQPTEWTLAPYDDPELKHRPTDLVIRDGDLVLMHHPGPTLPPLRER
ncbi:DUF2079 domain-containing protein [Kribbella antibiotica]|uniref:DUF2079 domain-containing protein n=1 Tax=Kribbella antibiotica TaxID=190195 RepID=A0A4R4ZL35_9ACTN|nr:DUF2079 domain-containing protein [Kribbella antibiotica]TDD59265.1 DUF2079 domain-containing protein [Kribbella antibiotica]